MRPQFVPPVAFPGPNPWPKMSGRAKAAHGMIRSALSLQSARPRVPTTAASRGVFPVNHAVAAANTPRFAMRGGAMWRGAMESCAGALGAGAGPTQASLLGSSLRSSAPLAHAARAMSSSSRPTGGAFDGAFEPRVPAGMVWALRRSKPQLRDFSKCDLTPTKSRHSSDRFCILISPGGKQIQVPERGPLSLVLNAETPSPSRTHQRRCSGEI